MAVMLSLAEQQKLPWCGCDFRATGEWAWCKNYDWCAGRDSGSRSESRDGTARAEGRQSGPPQAGIAQPSPPPSPNKDEGR